MDKAIKVRDKIIEDQRNKVSDYRERFYDIQHENDNLKYELEKESKYSESLTSELKDLKFKFKNVCDKLKAKDEAVAEIVDKFKMTRQQHKKNLHRMKIGLKLPKM